MYITSIYKNEGKENFDWESFFSLESSNDVVTALDPVKLIAMLRNHLHEDKFQMTFVMNKLIKQLFQGMEIKSPRILELGAATGFFTRFLINRYGGTGVLVDKSQASYEKYVAMQDDVKNNITYLKADLFQLELEEKFDIVCSFGVIEHFVDKQDILRAHQKFTAPNGYQVILIPLDSPLSRAFQEIHPELNLGYRELLTEKEFKDLLVRNGFQVIKTEISRGYCYDFVAALCKT